MRDKHANQAILQSNPATHICNGGVERMLRMMNHKVPLGYFPYICSIKCGGIGYENGKIKASRR